MSTTLNFKDIIDKPEWRPLNVAPNAHAAGVSTCSDLRNNEDRHPEIFQLASAVILNAYHVKNDGWMFLGTPALANTFGAGATMAFAPSMGPRGTIGAGCTPTSIVTTTAWTIGQNMLANRGDGIGFKVRIIGLAAGVVEERYVKANNAVAAAALTFELTAALSFTPAANDLYEFLSGRVYLLNTGAAGANQFKYWDVATRTFSAGLGYTNLPTLATDSCLLALDELYVPSTRNPGEGFLGVLVNTGRAANNTITGQAAGGDAGVLQNEYRNFQIRITKDVAIPTAVGQRRLITSHTAGASPVYTLSANWAVNPSTTGVEYVIENADFLLLVTGGTGNIYTYNPTPATITLNAGGTIAADAWANNAFAARGQNFAAGGTLIQAFGITPDTAKNARHSHFHSFRGNLATVDIFDIAGGVTGAWSLAQAIGYPSGGTLPTTATAWACAPATNEGRYAYMVLNTTGLIFRYDLLNRTVEAWATLRYTQSGTAAVGQRLDRTVFVDGSTKVGFLVLLGHLQTNFFDCLIQR